MTLAGVEGLQKAFSNRALAEGPTVTGAQEGQAMNVAPCGVCKGSGIGLNGYDGTPLARCSRCNGAGLLQMPERRAAKVRNVSMRTEVDEGRKDDAGKAPWSLLPFDAASSIVDVLTFGAKKYSPRNWERGMSWDRPFDACLRHLTAWWSGEKQDPETGLPHLAHAGCCILFLIAYERRGVGRDTRPNSDAR